MLEVFDAIINKNYPEINIIIWRRVWMSAFETNDINGVYFADRYYLWVEDHESSSSTT